MQNYGLLTDMANGIKEGLIAYQTTANMKRQNQLFNLMHGIQEGPGGQLGFTPEEQNKRDLEQKKISLESEGYDPESSSSQMTSGLLKSQGLNIPDHMSQAQLEKAYPILSQKIRGDNARDLARVSRLDRLDAQRERDQEKREEKNRRESEQDMMKLQKDVSGTQGLIDAVGDVEKELGAPLEDFSEEKGNLKLNGKSVDLPGVSVPGLGRLSGFSEKARNLQSAADTVFNTTLKDRSGAAVTDHEMDRLKKEFNAGKFNTETELVHALQRYKDRVAKVLKNREAGYNPDVVEKYREQGGMTSAGLIRGGKGQQQSLSPEDQEALNWASQNPEDSRAKKIFQSLSNKVGAK